MPWRLLFRGPERRARNAQILELARLEFVHPSMDAHVLLLRPSVLNDVSLDDILDLLLDGRPNLIRGFVSGREPKCRRGN